MPAAPLRRSERSATIFARMPFGLGLDREISFVYNGGARGFSAKVLFQYAGFGEYSLTFMTRAVHG